MESFVAPVAKGEGFAFAKGAGDAVLEEGPLPRTPSGLESRRWPLPIICVSWESPP